MKNLTHFVAVGTQDVNEKKSSYSFEINFLKYKTPMIKMKNKLFWTKPSVHVTIPTWILDLAIGTVSILRKGLTSLGSTVSFAVEHFLIPKCFIAKHQFIDRIKFHNQLNHLFNIWSSWYYPNDKMRKWVLLHNINFIISIRGLIFHLFSARSFRKSS